MRPSELKVLNEKNGGKFFNPSTMAFWGDTMRNFRCRDNGDGTVTLYRHTPTKAGMDEYIFCKTTGRKLHTMATGPMAKKAA